MELPYQTHGSAAEPPELSKSDASLLVGLIDELTTAARQGENPDVEALAIEHPRLADELRSLWAMIWVTESLARTEGPVRPIGEETVQHPSAHAEASADRFSSSQSPVDFGGYQLFEELGQGGMGVVFRARELDRGRIVALKRLLRGAGSKAQDVERFRVEAMAAAQLAHPHIVPVFQVGEHEGQPFFTMQYIEGTTLARRLADGPMPALDAARLLVPICRAIHSAHDRGILHRDLKPSNILIDAEGHSYVSDFGLAKRLDLHADASLTPSGAIVGTPGYMPPEQARASASPGPARTGMRRLQPGSDPLSHAYRPAAVSGRQPGRDLDAGPRARSRAAAGIEPAGELGPGDDHPAAACKNSLVSATPAPRPWPTTSRRSCVTSRSPPARPAFAPWPAGSWERPTTPAYSRTGASSGSTTVWPCWSSSGRRTSCIWPECTARWPYVLIFTVGLGALGRALLGHAPQGRSHQRSSSGSSRTSGARALSRSTSYSWWNGCSDYPCCR